MSKNNINARNVNTRNFNYHTLSRDGVRGGMEWVAIKQREWGASGGQNVKMGSMSGYNPKGTQEGVLYVNNEDGADASGNFLVFVDNSGIGYPIAGGGGVGYWTTSIPGGGGTMGDLGHIIRQSTDLTSVIIYDDTIKNNFVASVDWDTMVYKTPDASGILQSRNLDGALIVMDKLQLLEASGGSVNAGGVGSLRYGVRDASGDTSIWGKVDLSGIGQSWQKLGAGKITHTQYWAERDISNASGHIITTNNTSGQIKGSGIEVYPADCCGNYSMALGPDCSSGQYSLALGFECNTTAVPLDAGGALAIGYGCRALGMRSVAMGQANHAAGDYSFAMGVDCSAGGIASFADGSGCIARRAYSVALGYNADTSSNYQFVVGISNNVAASGMATAGGNTFFIDNSQNVAMCVGGDLGFDVSRCRADVPVLDISGDLRVRGNCNINLRLIVTDISAMNIDVINKITAVDISATNMYTVDLSATRIFTIDLSATNLDVSGRAFIADLSATKIHTVDLSATRIFTIDLSATNLDVSGRAFIADLSATKIHTVDLSATRIFTIDLSATNLDVSGRAFIADLSATKIHTVDLSATRIFTIDLSATNLDVSGRAFIADLSATKIHTVDLSATRIFTIDLSATNLDVSGRAFIADLSATKIHTVDLSATRIFTIDLSATNLDVSGRAFIADLSATKIHTVDLSASNVNIGDCSITSTDLSGVVIDCSLSLNCHNLLDVSGIYFCDSTYIGHGDSFDISTNQLLRIKSSNVTIGSANNTANGTYAVAMGYDCSAGGIASFADGSGCIVAGDYSVAMGQNHNVQSNNAMAIGGGGTSVEPGDEGNWIGWNGTDLGGSAPGSVVMGTANSICFGENSTADYAFAMGNTNRICIGESSHGEGAVAVGVKNRIASDPGSYAVANYAVAMGNNNKIADLASASAIAAVAMGSGNTVRGNYAVAMGFDCSAGGICSFADGSGCTAWDECNVALGCGADASGTCGFMYKDTCGNEFCFDSSGSTGIAHVGHLVINGNIIGGGDYHGLWNSTGSEAHPTPPEGIVLYPTATSSSDDPSGIRLRHTLIYGTDASGLMVGDGNTAAGDYAVAMGFGNNVQCSNAMAIGGLGAPGGGNWIGWDGAKKTVPQGSGTGSVVMGNANSICEGGSSTANYAFAMGNTNKICMGGAARGRGAVAMGVANRIASDPGTNAKATFTVAMGHNNKIADLSGASAIAAVAMGSGNIVRGDYAVAMGKDCSAGNPRSVALGCKAETSNNYQFVLGISNESMAGNTFFIDNSQNVAIGVGGDPDFDASRCRAGIPVLDVSGDVRIRGICDPLGLGLINVSEDDAIDIFNSMDGSRNAQLLFSNSSADASGELWHCFAATGTHTTTQAKIGGGGSAIGGGGWYMINIPNDPPPTTNFVAFYLTSSHIPAGKNVRVTLTAGGGGGAIGTYDAFSITSAAGAETSYFYRSGGGGGGGSSVQFWTNSEGCWGTSSPPSGFYFLVGRGGGGGTGKGDTTSALPAAGYNGNNTGYYPAAAVPPLPLAPPDASANAVAYGGNGGGQGYVPAHDPSCPEPGFNRWNLKCGGVGGAYGNNYESIPAQIPPYRQIQGGRGGHGSVFWAGPGTRPLLPPEFAAWLATIQCFMGGSPILQGGGGGGSGGGGAGDWGRRVYGSSPAVGQSAGVGRGGCGGQAGGGITVGDDAVTPVGGFWTGNPGNNGAVLFEWFV